MGLRNQLAHELDPSYGYGESFEEMALRREREERERREKRERNTHVFLFPNEVQVKLCTLDYWSYSGENISIKFEGNEPFLWDSGLIPKDVKPEHLETISARWPLELFFDKCEEGYILNLPQWRIEDRVEKARKYANRPKETTPLEKCTKERDSAKVFEVKISEKEAYDCPILATQGKRNERYWALIGEQCFPVEYAGNSTYALYTGVTTPSLLKDVLESIHASRGWRFVQA